MLGLRARHSRRAALVAFTYNTVFTAYVNDNAVRGYLMTRRKGDDDDADPKPLVFLHGEIKTPPFSEVARKEAGYLLGLLQDGESLAMPSAEPLPIVGPRCGAIRVRDAQHNWRIMYRVDATMVLVVDVYDKKTRRIPDEVIDRCKQRLKNHDVAKAAQTKKEKPDGR
jgi:phage-related protein